MRIGDRLLRRVGLVRTSVVLDAVRWVDEEQRAALRPGVITAWAVCTYLDAVVDRKISHKDCARSSLRRTCT